MPVGFAAVTTTVIKSADISMAKLVATDWINRFAGEMIEVQSELDESLTYRPLEVTDEQVLDASVYDQRIASLARSVRLSGVHQVLQWRGKHPH